MIVLNVRRKVLQCRIISKDRRFRGKVVLIPRIRLSPNAETLPVNGVYSVKFHIAFYYLLQLHIYISLLYLKSSACCSYILVIPLAMHMLQIAPPPGRYWYIIFIYKVYTCKPKSQSFYWLLGAYACKTNHLWILNV